ncbi:MAG: ECF transporter S component [Blautia sp.]|nr:ECF transporter S component [Blautia sp.]
MKKQLNASQISLLGLMTALLLLMAYTPLGYLNIGPLAITLNTIPVAISALALGPVGGAVAGAIFGLTSFGQCLGIGGSSAMGVMLLGINPVFAFIQRFVPRVLMGYLVGLLSQKVFCKLPRFLHCALTGFFAAFFNTLFFMSALLLLFGNTEYVQGLVNGRNYLVFVCAFVGVNAVFEMCFSTAVCGLVGYALSRAHLLGTMERSTL